MKWGRRNDASQVASQLGDLTSIQLVGIQVVTNGSGFDPSEGHPKSLAGV